MNETRLTAIYDFCAMIPPRKAEELLCALREQKKLLPAGEYARLCGLNADLTHDLSRLLKFYNTPAALAAALETGVFFHQKSRASPLSFVWSESAQLFADVRKTEQTLLDLINGAREQILLVSFAAYKVPDLLAPLRDAIKRGARTRLVLENSHDSAGQLTHDGKSAFRELEGAEFYHWPLALRSRNAAGMPAKMHAKCAVNENSFLVTSANLTNDAINGNLELGVLCHDRAEAAKLLGQFDLLIGRNILTRQY